MSEPTEANCLENVARLPNRGFPAEDGGGACSVTRLYRNHHIFHLLRMFQKRPIRSRPDQEPPFPQTDDDNDTQILVTIDEAKSHGLPSSILDNVTHLSVCGLQLLQLQPSLKKSCFILRVSSNSGHLFYVVQSVNQLKIVNQLLKY